MGGCNVERRCTDGSKPGLANDLVRSPPAQIPHVFVETAIHQDGSETECARRGPCGIDCRLDSDMTSCLQSLSKILTPYVRFLLKTKVKVKPTNLEGKSEYKQLATEIFDVKKKFSNSKI